MEWAGVRIDSAELHRQSVELTDKLRVIEQEAYELAGEKFNISSPMQVGEVLFGKLKLDPKAKRTKKRGLLHNRRDSGEAPGRASACRADS